MRHAERAARDLDDLLPGERIEHEASFAGSSPALESSNAGPRTGRSAHAATSGSSARKSRRQRNGRRVHPLRLLDHKKQMRPLGGGRDEQIASRS